jgi:hypothetical protein
MPKRLTVSRKALRALSIVQLVELGGLVRELIQRAKEDERLRASKERKAVEEKTRDNKTYRQVAVRCGKENCRCANGKGHGPYWYAFWSENGQTRCRYIGKKLSRPE